MIEEALESMVTHLVQCTCNGTIDCSKTCNGDVPEHEDLALKQPISDAQNKTFIAWNSIIKGLLSQSTQLSSFGREMINSSNPIALNCQQIYNRKVLAPLTLKLNTDNIIAGNLDMTRKRKSNLDQNSWEPLDKIPKCDFSKNNLKLCSVILKRTSVRNLMLQHRFVTKTPFVKLFDVLKEIPQKKEIEKPVEKNEFMNFFDLKSRESVITKIVPDIKTNHPIKLTKTVGIPFSSIYGQTLLLRERHCLSEEAALKKIERTNWYLKDAKTNRNPDYTPLVTYDKKPKYIRNYKFPKRHFHQKHKTFKQEFLEYLCKPVCVKLEKFDMTSFLIKQKQAKKVQELPKEDEVITISDEDSDGRTTFSDSVSDAVNVQNVGLQLIALCDSYSNSPNLNEQIVRLQKFSTLLDGTSNENKGH